MKIFIKDADANLRWTKFSETSNVSNTINENNNCSENIWKEKDYSGHYKEKMKFSVKVFLANVIKSTFYFAFG